MVFNLSENNSVVHHYLYQLRDRTIQRDSMRFRKNLERIGEMLAFEISRTLEYNEVEISTPVGKARVKTLADEPALLTILRAGLPFMQGFLNVFDGAEAGFVGAFREEKGEAVVTQMGYLATPAIAGKTVIVADPMLATGGSLIKCLEAILRTATPEMLHVACVIAAPEGIASVRTYLERRGLRYSIWLGALDERLNDQFFIVPGLGDAGDLSFGKKL